MYFKTLLMCMLTWKTGVTFFDTPPRCQLALEIWRFAQQSTENMMARSQRTGELCTMAYNAVRQDVTKETVHNQFTFHCNDEEVHSRYAALML